MRNNQFNSLLPRVFGETLDSIFNTGLTDFMGSDFNLNTPSVNVIEMDDKFKIELAAPGLTKEDFNIEIDNDRLKISSHIESTEEEKSDDNKYLRREFNYQSFVRSFTLPRTVDKDSIEANYEDGVLCIELLKREEAVAKPPKTINIK